MIDPKEYEELLRLPKGEQAEELGKRLQELCEQHASEGKNTTIIPVHVLDALSHILQEIGSEHQQMKKTLVDIRKAGNKAAEGMNVLIDVFKDVIFYLEKHESESDCDKSTCHMSDFTNFFNRKMKEGSEKLYPNDVD